MTTEEKIAKLLSLLETDLSDPKDKALVETRLCHTFRLVDVKSIKEEHTWKVKGAAIYTFDENGKQTALFVPDPFLQYEHYALKFARKCVSEKIELTITISKNTIVKCGYKNKTATYSHADTCVAIVGAALKLKQILRG